MSIKRAVKNDPAAALKGVAGPPGRPGTTGAPGLQGKPGEKGERGDEGPPGDKGLRGDQGPEGKKGPDGNKGPVGDKGQGPEGRRGPDGNKGPEGDKGPPGDKGPIGDKGQLGDRGPSGDVTVVSIARRPSDASHIYHLSEIEGAFLNANDETLDPLLAVEGTSHVRGCTALFQRSSPALRLQGLKPEHGLLNEDAHIDASKGATLEVVFESADPGAVGRCLVELSSKLAGGMGNSISIVQFKDQLRAQVVAGGNGRPYHAFTLSAPFLPARRTLAGLSFDVEQGTLGFWVNGLREAQCKTHGSIASVLGVLGVGRSAHASTPSFRGLLGEVRFHPHAENDAYFQEADRHVGLL